jgi:NADPH-dependent ferric siderophore reductase
MANTAAVELLGRILERSGVSAPEVQTVLDGLDELRYYSTEAALLADSLSDGFIAYASDTDTFWFRRNGAWSQQTAAGAIQAIVSKTSAYTATVNDRTILVDATGGAVTVTLPAAADNSGRIYTVKKVDSSANAVTVDGNASETIDGATTRVLSEQWEEVTFQCNGTSWFVLSQGRREPLTTKTASYTATANDQTILVDATSGAATITLPAAASHLGRRYVVKKIDSSANAVTVDANASETIDGVLTKVLREQYEAITIQSDGTNWYALSREKVVPTTSKTGAYTATANDHTILCDATGGAFTVALPAAATAAGRVYAIKKTDAGANAVTIDPSGAETIDGGATKALADQNDSALIICNGTAWFILASNGL